jgi:hypothetical protein
MRSNARWVVLVGTVVILIVLFALLRPSGSEPRASSTPSTPTPTMTSSGSPSPTPSPEPSRTVVSVRVHDGVVEAPDVPTARRGDRVRIVVVADVSDEVHLHGYDLHADVAPGEPGRIDFVADAAGVFECELEEAGKLLFRLEIVP